MYLFGTISSEEVREDDPSENQGAKRTDLPDLIPDFGNHYEEII